MQIKFFGTLLLIVLAMMAGCSRYDDTLYDGPKTKIPGLHRFSKPYTIWGTTYYPQDYYEYDQEGVASWYGPGFHGKPTPYGEPYNQHGLTAAHKTLPLPSVALVTSLKTGKTIKVIINDRGPFIDGREIDLSVGAAKALGVYNDGLSKVRVQTLPSESYNLCKWLLESGNKSGRDPSGRGWENVYYEEVENKETKWTQLVHIQDINKDFQPKQNNLNELVMVSAQDPAKVTLPNKKKMPAPAPGYFIQVGSYVQKKNAQKALNNLREISNGHITTVKASPNQSFFVVKLGPYNQLSKAKTVFNNLMQKGYSAMITK